MVQACKKLGIGLRTACDWLAQHEDFRTRCAGAREMQAEVMDDRILAVADSCDESNAHSSKVKISAYQWRASKLAPKKYGDKVGLTNAAGDGPAEIVIRRVGGSE